MAITATLVFVGHNRMRYLIVADTGGGESVVIPASAGATPDLLTDSMAGPLRNIFKVGSDGYGILAAGAQTQAKARALLLALSAASVVGINIPVAFAKFTPRSGSGVEVDANVNAGVIEYVVLANAICTGYLDISVHALGVGGS